jgi:hypothetical protein
MKERNGGEGKPKRKSTIESNAHQKKQIEPLKRKVPKKLRVSITEQELTVSRVNMTEAELKLLTDPEKWVHEYLPMIRRGGNPIYKIEDAGLVMRNNLCRVWSGVYLGYLNPWEGKPEDYDSPVALLSEWEID